MFAKLKKFCAKFKKTKKNGSKQEIPPECVAPEKKEPYYTLLGKGTYGAVFSPALPNRVDDKNVAYPNNVTKLFHDKYDYNAMMERMNTVRSIMGENVGHPYARNYKKSNLRNVAPRIYKELKDRDNNENVHLMRMPYLGYDARYIDEYGYDFPKRTLLEQISKLIHQTKTIASHNYIHGDIRAPNLMIHPDTGVVTIIDYDWFMSFDQFLESYSGFGYHSNPPEWLIKHPSKFNDYVKDNLETFPYLLKDVTTEQLGEQIINANKDNETYIKTPESYFKSPKSLITFDNYCLALTLLNILAYLYPNPPSNSPLEQTIALLKRMGSMRIAERPTPTEAAAEMDAILNTVSGGKRTRKRRSHGKN